MNKLLFLLILFFIISCKHQESEIHNDSKSNYDSSLNNNAQRSDSVHIVNAPNYVEQHSNYPFIPEDSIIGVGVVSKTNISPGEKITIYNESNKVIVTIEYNEKGIVTNIGDSVYQNFDTISSFNPRLFVQSTDYFRLAFDCLEKTDKGYKVVINRKNQQIGFIRKDDLNFEFQTIEEYVNDWSELGIDFNRATNPLRQSPSDSSKIITNENVSKYDIRSGRRIKLKDDWMKIIDNEDDSETGWIRWRIKNQILIRLHYAC